MLSVEEYWTMLLLLLSLVVVVLSVVAALKNLWRRSWPPGPPAWPIIGHLHLLGDLPHQSLCKLSKTYGPLMGLYFGSIPTIVASSPDMAKQILHAHDSSFASRPRFDAPVHIVFDCSDIAFAPQGPLWRFMRQICVTELFTPKRLEGFKQIRVEEIKGIAQSVLERGYGGEKPVEFRRILLAASNSINCRMALGNRITELSAIHQRDVLSMIDEVMYLLGAFNVGDFIPYLKWLDLQGYVKRMKAAGQSWKNILQEVMDRRRETRAAVKGHPPCNDLLDVLLDAAASNRHNMPITDDNIHAILMDLFIGGAETSATTVEWGLAELLKNPEEMRLAQEELDMVVGRDRLVKDEDVQSLPYLCAMVKEIFRMHPPVPLLIPRETIRECRLEGYKIPPKTLTYVNAWAIGRDPALWERPLHFSPARFLNSTIDFRGQHFEFLPFGSGRRGCPGMTLAVLNVHLMLATILQAFDWSIPHKDDLDVPQIDMSERTGITITMAKPVCALAKPRLSLHLLR